MLEPSGTMRKSFSFLSSDFSSRFEIHRFREFEDLGQAIVPYVPSYLDANIQYIGGCCHVGPDQIRAIRDLIDQRSKHLSND